MIICEWNLQFVDTFESVTSKKLYSNRIFLGPVRKIKRLGLSHILEMKFTSMTRLNLMLYEHSLQQPMSMLERLPDGKLYKNPDHVEMTKDLYLTL